MNIPRALIGLVALSVAGIAPLPSAYFVAVASMRHFDAPLEIAVVIAVVIEGLGFAVSHLAVEFWTHNTHTNRLAKYRAAWVEFWLCIGMYALYFVATVGLLVVLDVMPELKQTAKVLFPFLAMVGVVSIGLTFQLSELKAMPKMTARDDKPVRHEVPKIDTYADFVTWLSDNGNERLTPTAIVARVGDKASVSDRTLYRWINRKRGEIAK